MSLDKLSALYIPALEAEMQALLAEDAPAFTPYYGMLRYHMGWADETFAPARVDAGKRIRPLLCLLVTQASGGDWQQALPAAVAIEFSHNFSLIHDDIQDASPLRRGRPTVWKLWGVPQALNIGDALFTLAHLEVKKLTERGVRPEVALEVLEVLDRNCLELTKGQYLDLSFERRERVSVEEYMAMIAAKTAALAAASTQIGALVAGAPAGCVAHYRAFGYALGLAFQIQDDILGIWGDEHVTGKSVSTDIQTRKKSLPVVYGLERSEALRAMYATGPLTDAAAVAQVVRELEAVSARAYAEEQVRAYSDAAIQHLKAAEPQGEAAEALLELTHRLVGRLR
uniref:Polyprenyl synthetase n=1 Tax=uncultured prokaryote TaxID=198431 RepID=H5SCN8_9ZZZZ|nr:polyprenyl synthetase [uncultured prokaryote]